jgi:hypothetical protein
MQTTQASLFTFVQASVVHALVDDTENCPSGHTVHFSAPSSARVSVTDPAPHFSHADSAVDPTSATKRPDGHPMQFVKFKLKFKSDAKRPEGHPTQKS